MYKKLPNEVLFCFVSFAPALQIRRAKGMTVTKQRFPTSPSAQGSSSEDNLSFKCAVTKLEAFLFSEIEIAFSLMILFQHQ